MNTHQTGELHSLVSNQRGTHSSSERHTPHTMRVGWLPHWLRRTSLTPIGVDVDSRSIAAVQLQRDRDNFIVHAGTVLARTNDQSPPDRAEIQRLHNVLHRHGFVGDRIVLAVPNDKLLTGVLDLPPVNSGAPIDQIARMELARMHKCDPSALELSYWDLPQRHRSSAGGADSRSTNNVMAAACAATDAAPILDAFEHAGFDVHALDVHSWAMARACAPLIPASAISTALLDIRWNAAVLVLQHQRTVMYQRIIPEAGLQTLHAALIEQLELAPELAEMVLCEEGLTGSPHRSGPRSSIATKAYRLISAHLDAMAQEVRVSCSYMSHRYVDSSPEVLMLMGIGANIPGVAEYVASAMQMNVKTATATQLSGHGPALAPHCAGSALTVAMGLAQHGVGGRAAT